MFKTAFDHGCVLVTGGAKSGKSRFALNMCNALNRKKIFLATAQALDREMDERIKRHRAERDEEWLTVEEPLNVTETIRALDKEDTVILLECVALWISNLFMKFDKNRDAIEQAFEDLLEQLSGIRGVVLVVSNEVGMSIVPDNALSRKFRDDVGSMNQKIALLAKKVVACMAGLPLVLKDE